MTEAEQAKHLATINRSVATLRAALMFFDATEWRADGDGRVFKPEFENAKMFVQDGSDYVARLYTKPDFGCLEFQAAKAQAVKTGG